MSVYLVVVLGAALAGFAQGLSGFAFGLVAMSVWAWSLAPQTAAVLAVAGALTGQLVAVFTVRRGFDLARLLPFVAGGLLGVPLGVWLLPQLDVVLFKALLGLLLVLWCPAMLLASRWPQLRWGGRRADALAGLIGGVMGGLGGFTGAVPTLWCLLRGWSKDEQRAVVQNFNLSMLAVSMAVYLGTGMVTRDMLSLLAISLPAMLVPALLGARLYARISVEAFRRVVLALLIACGVALLSSSLPQLLARV